MLRKTLLGASSLALFATAACAQEEPSETTASEPESAEETQMTEPETVEENQTTSQSEMKILDASQVNTKEEAELYAKSEFKQADINRDGSVDEDEFLAYAVIRAPMEDTQETTEEPSPAGDSEVADDDAAVTGESDMAAADEPATAEEQFAEISNGDDTISESEMVESRIAQFDEADANDDEQLDSEEQKHFVKLAELKQSSSTSL